MLILSAVEPPCEIAAQTTELQCCTVLCSSFYCSYRRGSGSTSRTDGIVGDRDASPERRVRHDFADRLSTARQPGACRVERVGSASAHVDAESPGINNARSQDGGQGRAKRIHAALERVLKEAVKKAGRQAHGRVSSP